MANPVKATFFAAEAVTPWAVAPFGAEDQPKITRLLVATRICPDAGRAVALGWANTRNPGGCGRTGRPCDRPEHQSEEGRGMSRSVG